MVEVSKEGDSAVFNVKGLHKLWAFKSQIQIPLAHIRGARQDAEALKGWWKGFRAPGTHVPGLITAGTFYQDDKRIFWDVHNSENAVIIDLVHDEYNQLIVEVEDPAAVIALLERE
ncbi:PH domain-containing protein [Hymenobacter volaticus]|uniref:PH domain-containing protein n=1 Tax=Hymenobacter volaticus TaxID=2932254 RepID=A0ABY4G9J3_9BACT|nr:PH domain-containing protein [Hymenobacter volaticus]UOQ67249.1 PH domain-containing protein [Hymenobacter volaticus]